MRGVARGQAAAGAGARSGGFTLVEVMFALGILGFGLLTLAAVQIQAMQQGSAGRHTADAAAVARSYLEQAHRLPWASMDAAVAAGSWTDPSWAGAAATVDVALEAAQGAGTLVEHSYGVQWRVTEVGGNACLRDVEVQVSWAEENRSSPKTLQLLTRRFNWGDASC